MKINRNYLFLLIALSILLGVVADFLVEILAPDLDVFFEKHYGENYQSRLWRLLLVIIGGLALLAFWQSRTQPAESDKDSSASPDESLQNEIRNYLKSRYEHRIRQKLAGREPVNLRKIPSSTGTSDEGAQNFITLSAEKVPSGMAELFDEARGRLLVVGAPGAGKTTLLLQLALALLERPGKDLPVLLNLATWRSEFATFDEWLQRILPLELGASKALAEKIRRNTPLILLLDGLDEVPEDARASCLKAIGEYGAEATHRFVISSRIAEYAATQDAPVYLEMEVQPLTPQQVIDNLTAYVFNQPEAKPLLNALQTDPLLREAVVNPFYLNTAQLLFATGRKYSDFGFAATDVAGRQRELVERFVEDALGRKVGREYPKEKARKWLGFLAGKMEENGKVRFELSDINPLSYKSGKILTFLDGHELITTFMFLGILSMIGIFSSLIRHLLLAIIVITLSLLLSILLLIFYTFYVLSMGRTSDILVWSWKKWKEKILDSVPFLIFCSCIFYLCALSFLEERNLFALILLFLTIILMWFLIVGIGFHTIHLVQLKHPYHRFYASVRNLNFTLLGHFFLRAFLAKEGLFPLRLATFLNEMSRRHLLEFDGDPETGKGGGSWRWRHRIIQEYFLEARDEK